MPSRHGPEAAALLIRPIRPADAPGLGEGMKAVADERVWIGTQTDRTAAELTERIRAGIDDEARHTLVLDEGERVVGTITLEPTRHPGVHGLGMWILAEFRGQGWGRRLLDAILAVGRDQGARKITLEVWQENARAIALYATAGFVIEGMRRDHYRRLDGSLRSSLIMSYFYAEHPPDLSAAPAAPTGSPR